MENTYKKAKKLSIVNLTVSGFLALVLIILFFIILVFSNPIIWVDPNQASGSADNQIFNVMYVLCEFIIAMAVIVLLFEILCAITMSLIKAVCPWLLKKPPFFVYFIASLIPKVISVLALMILYIILIAIEQMALGAILCIVSFLFLSTIVFDILLLVEHKRIAQSQASLNPSQNALLQQNSQQPIQGEPKAELVANEPQASLDNSNETTLDGELDNGYKDQAKAELFEEYKREQTATCAPIKPQKKKNGALIAMGVLMIIFTILAIQDLGETISSDNLIEALNVFIDSSLYSVESRIILTITFVFTAICYAVGSGFALFGAIKSSILIFKAKKIDKKVEPINIFGVIGKALLVFASFLCMVVAFFLPYETEALFIMAINSISFSTALIAGTILFEIFGLKKLKNLKDEEVCEQAIEKEPPTSSNEEVFSDFAENDITIQEEAQPVNSDQAQVLTDANNADSQEAESSQQEAENADQDDLF